MDPDKTLNDALADARAVLDDAPHQASESVDLAEALVTLDEWLARGGYLPARWRGTDGTTRPIPEADASGNPAWHRPGSAEPPRPEHDLSGGIDWLPEALS